MCPLNILKDLNFHYKWKHETELRNCFFSDSLMVIAYLPVLEIWQDLSFDFCRGQEKNVSILTANYLNLDQIQPSLYHTEGLLVLIHSGELKMLLRLTLIQKGRCVL